MLPLERRGSVFDEIKKPLPSGPYMGAVLDILRRPKFLRRRVISLIEQTVECLARKQAARNFAPIGDKKAVSDAQARTEVGQI